MTCKNHINRQAFNRCSKCGDYVCDECNIVVKGESVCKTCATEMIENTSGGSASYSVKRKSSALLLFCFSALPGANYMYLGLIKRGIFIMVSFLVSCFIVSGMNFGTGITAMIPMVIFFASFFEGFKIRKTLSRGVPVEDSFDGIMKAFDKFKGHIIIGIIFLVAFEFISELSYFFGYDSIMHYIFSLVRVVFGIVLMFFGFSILKKSGKEKVIETYEDSSTKNN